MCKIINFNIFNSSNMSVNNIYWERQVGNNCRIHSLNAFFGKKMISEDNFIGLCNEYDKLVPGLESIKMDGFAESRSIISYIIDKFTHKYVQLIPINMRNIHHKNRQQWGYDRFIKYLGREGGILNYFEFNKDHIWVNRFINDKWYKIDSLSGITNINKQRSFGENGYLLVFEKSLIFLEIEYLINLIKSKKLDDDIEIAFYSLFHLLNRIKLEYDLVDAEFNSKITSLRLLLKILNNYINLNRNDKVSNKKDTLKKNIDELNNIIRIIEF